jgi:hypothetical protein
VERSGTERERIEERAGWVTVDWGRWALGFGLAGGGAESALSRPSPSRCAGERRASSPPVERSGTERERIEERAGWVTVDWGRWALGLGLAG